MDINLQELRYAADVARKKFKIGDRVVIDNSYSGIWSDLVGLTGTISGIHDDAMWTFSIELDHPQFLFDISAWNHSRDGGLMATIGCGGIWLVNVINPDLIPELNRGKGISPRPFCSESPALTNVDEKLDAIDKIIKEHQKESDIDCSKFVEVRKRCVDNMPQRGPELTKHEWAEANIPEFKKALAIYNKKCKEFSAFYKTKMDEIDKILHEYVGRRHINIKQNGEPKEEGVPMICQDCGWKFIPADKGTNE